MIRLLKIFGLALLMFIGAFAVLFGIAYFCIHVKYGYRMFVFAALFGFCAGIANSMIKK